MTDDHAAARDSARSAIQASISAADQTTRVALNRMRRGNFPALSSRSKWTFV
jgi:hypothetical protein